LLPFHHWVTVFIWVSGNVFAKTFT
jgi:hypothetical protein